MTSPPSSHEPSIAPPAQEVPEPGALRSLLDQAKQGAKRALQSCNDVFYFDLNRDYHKTVFLAGDGRSGTTWISDIINYDNSYRYIFEPFHAHFVPLSAAFKNFQYLRPDDQDQRFLEPARKILTGSYWHPRIDRFNKRRWSSRRLVKDIFANLFLKWLSVQFPGMPLILAIRHPCAVAASKMELKEWIWSVNPRDFLEQTPLVADHLEPFRDLILATTDPFEQQILHWCITHYVPLEQFQRGQVHVVFYEHLCTRREQEIQRLFKYLNEPWDENVILASKKPSATSRTDSAVVRTDSLIEGWRRKVSPAQLRRAVDILRCFNLERTYSESPEPNVANPEDCLAP